MDDNKLIGLFFERSEAAISELDAKYGRLCRITALNILGSKEDAEECVNDSYLLLWNRIPPECPQSLRAFLLKVVRYHSLRRACYNKAKKRDERISECIDELGFSPAAADTVESELERKELKECIEAFLDSLSKTDRMIFIRRYWFFDSIQDISKLAGLSTDRIYSRLSRMRAMLKQFLEEKGVTL